MEVIKNFKAFCRRFIKARKGNVAIIFGVMMVPTMVLSGGLVDYGMAIKTKSQLVATLDAAMLAAMLQYTADEDADYQKIIEDYIDQNFTQSNKKVHGTIIEVSTAAISDEGEMSASLTASVPTNFLKFVHKDTFEFSIGAAVMVGGTKLELALVLDNTGSMSGSKIKALKKSATNLVDIIMPKDQSDYVKISVIPFADYVNVKHDDTGISDRDEPGLDIPDDYTVSTWKNGGKSCKNTYPQSTQKCKNKPKKWGTCYNDGVSYPCKKYNGKTCTGKKGPKKKVCTWKKGKETKKKYNWHGCMASRAHDLNVRDDGYGTGVPGVMATWNWCKQIAPITRLTDEKSVVTAGLDRMKAKRSTYIPSGLAWGWRSLSPTSPLADGATYTSRAIKKVIVLMTDGDNTKSTKEWTGDDTKQHLGAVWGHNSSKSSKADTYTKELCANILDKGIMIFTIGFDIPGGSKIEKVMKKCAGNGGQYFDADDSSELDDAFAEIGKSLLTLRLSK